MGWRILAILNVALVVVTIATLAANGGRTTTGGLIQFAVSVLVAAGVAGYAFRKPALSPIAWRVVAALALALAVLELGPVFAAFQKAATSPPLVATVMMVVVVGFLGVAALNVVGVWRYADWLAAGRDADARA